MRTACVYGCLVTYYKEKAFLLEKKTSLGTEYSDEPGIPALLFPSPGVNKSCQTNALGTDWESYKAKQVKEILGQTQHNY